MALRVRVLSAMMPAIVAAEKIVIATSVVDDPLEDQALPTFALRPALTL